MLSSNNLLLPALIFAAAGFLVGILAMTIFSERGKNKDKTKDASITPEMDDLTPPAAPLLPETRFESIAHIYREKASGKIVTDVKGKVHLTHSTIPPEQLSSLQEASRNWQYWLGIYESVPTAAPVKPPAESAAPPQASPEPPAPAPAPADPPAPAPVPAPSPAPAKPQPPAASPAAEVSSPAAAVTEPPVQTPPTAPASASASPAKQPHPVDKPRARTMVGQIEDILQEMLPDSEYAGQEIHLTEDPTNGVIVWVGAQKFTGINNVTDEGIKGLIQAAVRRWENSGGSM